MTKLVLTIWVVLLIPWLPLAGFAGLAFDGATTPGRTVVAWIFVLLIWTNVPRSGMARVRLPKGTPAPGLASADQHRTVCAGPAGRRL